MNKSKALWNPNNISSLNIYKFIDNVNKKYSLQLSCYDEIYQWSINNLSNFWNEIFDFAKIRYSKPFKYVLKQSNEIQKSKWFYGLRFNFAENLLRYKNDDIAIIFQSEDKIKKEISFNQLYNKVSKVSQYLENIGIEKSDKVAAILPNIPESVIAMLGVTSKGAVWSSTSPDFGVDSILDRFSQINPKVLFVCPEYYYKGRKFNIVNNLNAIIKLLPSLEQIIVINYVLDPGSHDFEFDYILWDNIQNQDTELIKFTQVDFSHPLYIMYSSGTTGKPKSIVHSSGGALIQHFKELSLHCDLKKNERIFYFTTCGWMMWNWLISSLSVGASIMLYDGSPFFPKNDHLLDIADQNSINIFGTSASYISYIDSLGIFPNKKYQFKNLRCILSTGSPLVEKSFDFVYKHWKNDVLLGSISGGTDIISCFVLANSMLPVYKGKIQCKGLGMDVRSYNSKGESIVNQKGELVCIKPFPSMPIYFVNDCNGNKYKKAYFSKYPNIWHHGDYIKIDDDGNIEIFGRSDTTLNPGGIRIGTSEIYQVLERIDKVSDSIVVAKKNTNDEDIILFVKMKENYILDESMVDFIKMEIKKKCSPRHVPILILSVKDIPYTINGKKVEIAVKKIINGEQVNNESSISNPESLNCYKNVKELENLA